jgi:putative ABC transport system substrate-binding protein
VNRRIFLGGLTFGTIILPPAATARQEGAVPRIGYLSNSSGDSAPDRAFIDGSRSLGYVEGKNIVIAKRFSAGRTEQFPGFVSDLLRLKVDVIAAWSPSAVGAAQRATSTIPIVGISMGDPVAQGWALSLRRPGGNITGSANLATELSGKRIGLVKEVLPTVTRVAILANPASLSTSDVLGTTENAAQAQGIELSIFNVSEPKGFEKAFADANPHHSGALIVLPDGLYWAHRTEIVKLAAKNHLPAVYWAKDFVDAGGLMSYAASLNDLGFRAAYFIDKILTGAKPADLPIEQPTKFELIINLKTARALGLTIPPSLLARADQVIE